MGGESTKLQLNTNDHAVPVIISCHLIIWRFHTCSRQQDHNSCSITCWEDSGGGEGWQQEEDSSALTVFVLIPMLHVFGHFHNINQRVESKMQASKRSMKHLHSDLTLCTGQLPFKIHLTSTPADLDIYFLTSLLWVMCRKGLD